MIVEVFVSITPVVETEELKKTKREIRFNDVKINFIQQRTHSKLKNERQPGNILVLCIVAAKELLPIIYNKLID